MLAAGSCACSPALRGGGSAPGRRGATGHTGGPCCYLRSSRRRNLRGFGADAQPIFLFDGYGANFTPTVALHYGLSYTRVQ